MLRSGFAGPIWPVNPKRDVVQGLKAYASVADLPEAPDAVIVAVPAAAVCDTLEACPARGAKAVVGFSSGFAEIGAGGRIAQERPRATARAGVLRRLGPHCPGVL